MLQSLNVNINSDVNIYCIFDSLKEKNRQLLEKYFRNSRLKLVFIEFDKTVLPTLPIRKDDHVSPAAFFRIWLPEILKDLKQVLFLDSDIVINGNIEDLLSLQIENFAIAAVPDLGMSIEKKIGLGIKPDRLYFNSGVMILNLEYFRKHNLTERISEFIKNKPQLCEFWDQDAFNGILKGDFYQLDYRYNVQSVFYERFSEDPLIKKTLTRPVVIHFTGGGICKPWLYNNTHPFKKMYYKYLDMTPFKYYYPEDLPRKWRIFRIIKFIFFK